MPEQLRRAAAGYDGMTDEMLLDHIRRGEREAFCTIMQRHSQRLFRVARGIVAGDAKAERVLQESYARTFAAIGSFRGMPACLLG